MIHGRTEIILKSKYGLVERHKSDNTFQGDIISEGLRNLGYGKASLYNNLDSAIVANAPFAEIVGGLFLFKNAIPSGSQFMDAGNEMIGNGAFGILNTGEPYELGSFNVGDSLLDDPTKIILTWDFTTSQANGDISSVCLTSRTGGYIGYGNKNEKQMGNVWSLARNSGGGNICPQFHDDAWNNIICNGALYSFSLSGTDLTVKKMRIPLKNASVFDCIVDEKVIDVTNKGVAHFSNSLRLSASNGKIYMAVGNTEISGTVYLWEYDTASEELSEILISISHRTRNPIVAQGKLFLLDSEGGIKVYNLDGTLYDTISGEWGTGYNNQYFGDFGNHVLLQWNRSSGDKAWIYDVAAKTIKLTNANIELSNYQNQPCRQDETSKAICFPTYNHGFSGAFAFNNPLYLATINNLQRTVTKDATMVMKVIYTLEET